jgi:hypothetical protein
MATPASGSIVKIPNVRLSFITQEDQGKFEQLFKAAVGNGQALTGECLLRELSISIAYV